MEEYGTENYSSLGPIEFTATIMEDQENLYVPARYLVGEIRIDIGNVDLPILTEVLSFEGIFASVFHQGDRVRIRGTAEAVRDTQGNLIRNQVVVGTFSTRGWIVRISESR